MCNNCEVFVTATYLIFQIDNFDASLTRMVKYMLSSPQVLCSLMTNIAFLLGFL